MKVSFQKAIIRTIGILESGFREKERENKLRKLPGTEGHSTPVGQSALNIWHRKMEDTYLKAHHCKFSKTWDKEKNLKGTDKRTGNGIWFLFSKMELVT